MNKKKSFDSEASNSSDCDIEEVETKDQTRREEEDEEKKKFQNIDLIKAISLTLKRF